MKGQTNAAVELQERALEKAGERERPMVRATLDSYRRGQLPADE
jgi:hypothetical protein